MISAFMDGELNEDETSELLQHLASCASCRAVLDEYRALRDDLRALPP
ncbi:MAG: zf-HC2 domain-containing protein, partial [Thermomicrobiaceae bacterium]|nr:zf-HC2 domain-containing protein [Thermomicrobiaceae bacterium]